MHKSLKSIFSFQRKQNKFDEMGKKYFISYNQAGLGNRIKAIVTILRISEKLGRIPILCWPKNIGNPRGDFFNINIKEINWEQLKNLPVKKKEYYREWKDNLYSRKKFLIMNSWRLLLLKNEIPKKFARVWPTLKGNNIDFEYLRIPKKLREEIVLQFKKLKPQEEISKKVEEFVKKQNIEKCIGVHIRRRDFKHSPDGRGKISTDEKFIARMNDLINLSPKVKFFLSTDSKKTEKKFLKIFGDKIIIYNKKEQNVPEELCTNPGKDGLIEMLILSKTKKIFGTYLSTFTEAAWWFGGGNKDIEIIGDEDAEKKKEVIRKLKKVKNPFLIRIFKRIYLLFKRK